MKILFKNHRLPENLEVLFMLVLGILLQMTDGSPFSIRERWMIVWETELPAQNFSLLVQKCIKSVLSVIVVVRCVTTYAYVVSAMLVIFSIVKDTAPKLMLLWLLISGIKSVCMTFVEALTGVYVCSAFGKIRKACLEFFVSKALEIIFASYLWGCVINIYHDMERRAVEFKKPSTWEQIHSQKLDFKCHRPRSLIDHSTLYKTACLNNFEFKDVPQILLQMLRREEDMSQDSLLGPGMMLASVSNMGSFDNLKNSLSLGELGFTDLKSVQVMGLEEDVNMTAPEKALKFLKLTWSDVRKAQTNKTALPNEPFASENLSWNRLIKSEAHIKKPKQPRAEVFIKDIPQLELDEKGELLLRKPRKRSFELKFGLSLFNFFQDESSEKGNYATKRKSTGFSFEEEDEKEWEGEDLFMSNIKEEIAVNRIRIEFVSKAMKGDAYAKLYNQECMNSIGTEVFDRACKLPKVTSLSKVLNQEEMLVSLTMPLISEKRSLRKINFDADWIDKIEESESELYNRDFMEEKGEEEQDSLNVTLSKTEGETPVSEISLTQPEEDRESIKSHKSGNSTIPENITKVFVKNEPNQPQIESTPSLDFYVKKESKESSFSLLLRPKLKNRKIIIKRIRNRVRNQKVIEYFNASHKDFANDSDDSCVSQSRSESENDEATAESKGSKENSNLTNAPDFEELRNDNEINGESSQIYFLTELLQKPLSEVLIMYSDLRKERKVVKKTSGSFRVMRNRHGQASKSSLKSIKKKKPKWKSMVLKAAAADSSTESESELIETIRNVESSESSYNESGALVDKKGPRCSREKSNIDISSLVYKDSFLGKYKTPVILIDKENFIRTDFLLEKKTSLSTDPLESKSRLSINKNVSFYKLSKDDVSEDDEENGSRRENVKLKYSSLSVKNQSSNMENDGFENSKINQDMYSIEEQEEFDISPETYLTLPELPSSQDSDESFSLYYSKTADLASPLLDMKRFIYPDHIHYSYKHVKKKGFDVNITNGLPLLVRESLTMNPPSGMKKVIKTTNPELKITRRPMDLSFARTNAFAEWEPNESILKSSTLEKNVNHKDSKKNGKPKKWSKRLRSRKHNEKVELSKNKELQKTFIPSTACYSVKDYLLIAKLLRTLREQNSKAGSGKDRTPARISSTQLHSNKGRVNSMYNPAISLQENKSRNEKRKVESQEERTKDMFARLEREALWQSKNVNRSDFRDKYEN